MRQAVKGDHSRRLRPESQYSQVIKFRPWPEGVAAYKIAVVLDVSLCKHKISCHATKGYMDIPRKPQ